MESKNDQAELYELVEELTTSGQRVLDEKPLRQFKKLCKASENNVRHAYHIVRTQMEKDHAEIRLSTFQIINELFTRSHLFRTLVLEEFTDLLELSVETNEERKLPPPRNVAKILKSTALSIIEEWNGKFGKHYNRLALGYDYLERVKKIDFAGMRTRTEIERRRQERLCARQQEIEKNSTRLVDREINETISDIRSAITQAKNCLKLILPTPNELYLNEMENATKETDNQKFIEDSNKLKDLQSGESSSENNEESAEQGKHLHGLISRSYCLTVTLPVDKVVVTKTADNVDILKNLKEIMNEVTNKFVPMIKKWIHILTKCNAANGKLGVVVKLKNELKEIFEKYKEIEVIEMEAMSDCDSSDNGEFEDVPESSDRMILQDSLSVEETSGSQVPSSKIVSSESINAVPGSSKDTHESLRRHELLSRAPIVTFDHDLKYWNEDKIHITPITKNDCLHRFWTNAELDDGFIPDELEEVLRNRAIRFAGEFERVKWNCRAPLLNGKLCERQDRVKCPFHGKIIPRDESGTPTNPEDAASQRKEKHKIAENEAEDIRKEVEITTGKDLGSGKRQKNGGKKFGKSKQRYARLTNLKSATDTTGKRLENKVLSSSALKRVGEAMETIQTKRNLEKFGTNFNYHHER